MRNDNYWENIKFFIAGLLIIGVFILFIIARNNTKPVITVACNCAETSSVAINKRSDPIAEENVEQNRFSLETSEPVMTESKTDEIPESSTDLTSDKFKIGESVPLPDLPTHIKTFTDYRYYGLWYTPHYRLQQVAYTDNNGLRRFNEDYIVAMGAFYSTDIGDRFKVTLDSGSEFTVILGDGKHPCDCDETNMYDPCVDYDGVDCANVLEFIINDDVIEPSVYAYGSLNCIPKFKGNIIKMEYLGRDDSADWDTYETK